MELWIRSQSKQTLIKAEKIFTEDEEIYATTNSEFNERIGVYKSKERALEVLDEIQKYINCGCKQYISNGDYYTSKYEYRVYEWCQMFLSMLKEYKRIQQENEQLKENLEDYERIFDIWNKRKLINKFNKEFSKEKVKEERAKGNKIVGVIPDAEYVYKKYYEKVEQLDKAIKYLKKNACYDEQENYFNDSLPEICCKPMLEILEGGNDD